jgi:glycosyltransferase involved in cell wall biosynthesis
MEPMDKSPPEDSDTRDTHESTPLRIVVCHNYYQQRGGEDQVFEDEVALLRSHGHEVIPFTRRSSPVHGLETISAAAGTIWNRSAAKELAEIVTDEHIDIVHFHNWLPLISLAAPIAARAAGAAIVQSIQNYRFACPKGTFFRDGEICESCLGKQIPWPAVQHGCYRDSRASSALVAAALTTHRTKGTMSNSIDAYVAASRFTAAKVTAAGLPADRIAIKPNFLAPDPGVGSGSGGYAMYLGRLSPEKGIATLLEAWRDAPGRVSLQIAGTGPLQEIVEQAAAENENIEYLGFASDSVVDQSIKDAAVLVLPSVNYEGFPKTIVEAFARGTPVVASRLGAMEEAIDDGVTGYHFNAGDSSDLARVVTKLAEEPISMQSMRVAARQAYLDHFTADKNYAIMMDVYSFARQNRRTTEEGES